MIIIIRTGKGWGRGGARGSSRQRSFICWSEIDPTQDEAPPPLSFQQPVQPDLILPVSPKPVDFFRHLFDDRILTDETNRYVYFILVDTLLFSIITMQIIITIMHCFYSKYIHYFFKYLWRYADERIEQLRSANKLRPRSRFRNWTPTTSTEMEGFFGVVRNTGLVQLPD